MSGNIFRYYLAHPDINWTCAFCSLPPLRDSFVSEDSVWFVESEVSVGMHYQAGEGINSNQDLISPQELEAKRTNSSKELLLSHLNSQFNIPGFSLFRNDRKKAGGGILAFVSAVIPCKRLKFDRICKCIEAIALEITIGREEMIRIGMYRPPRALNGSYQLALEDELSDICNWASLQKRIVTVIGDLNLDRLRPNRSEGKLLIDLESEQGFECLMKEATRIEWKGATTTSTLIDVLLSNRPEMFKQCGDLFDDVDDQEYYWKTLMKDIVDECFPLNKMRVRSEDVTYMTTSWKNAIRAKRRASSKYYKDKPAHNWEVKQRCGNEATRQRRIAIK